MEFAFAPSLHIVRRTAVRTLQRSCPYVLPLSPRVFPSVRLCCTAANASPNASPTATSAAASTTQSAQQVPVGKYMTSSQIRQAFLDFFQSKQHTLVPSASLVPQDPSILLTIAGMVPFKPIFMGVQPPQYARATTCQKCIRTNDIENVGVTKRHHTFFEMLGNFSFGDYFKKDAILWAWQLLTKVYEIPPQRLAVSVYEHDEHAFEIWNDLVGVPVHRIQRLGKEHNFWAAGPTGPCGPCSEIYFDFDPLSQQPVDLEDDNRFIELYNLVFMQFSRDEHGVLTPLKNKNIDTGMGLERMAQVLQMKHTNYETDLFMPIINTVAMRAALSFENAQGRQQTSLKVIGDHMRAVAHLIADGVTPSNVGRGYIVRRLIRRVVRHGRLLGIEGPFTAQILPVVAELAGEAKLDAVQEKLPFIVAEVEREEKRFLATLERGEDCLQQVLDSVKAQRSTVISGDDAFLLYDTFGYPLELTEEIAAENGFSVDRDRFDVCMAEQRERARAAREGGTFSVESNEALTEAAGNVAPTNFLGYSQTTLDEVKIAAILVDGQPDLAEQAAAGDKIRVLLDESPFYAEGGGQVGDTGYLTAPNGVIRVVDTRKEGGAYVHIGQVTEGQITSGDTVFATVDATARRRIMAHHTATHLLQAALKEVIPEGGIAQAGSLVDADRLRFDFNCPRAVTAQELRAVEDVINKWIEEAHDTQVSHMTLDDAKSAGAVAMFGEKYDTAQVRVVDVPGVSMELCGGTHVENTADIGLFKIVSETGPSSGVRRIEAMCGAAVMPYLTVRDDAVRELSTSLKARPEELPGRVSALQEELKAKSKQLEAAKAELAIAKAMGLAESAKSVGDILFIVSKLDGDVSSDELKAAGESLGEKLGASGVVLLASENNGKVSFVASVGKKAQKKGILAGKLVGKVAKLCGGGGGGRPNLAQAGGKDPTKLADALALGESSIEEALATES